MKNKNLFQYVIMGAFVFFIIVGAIMFATYRSKSNSASAVSIDMWGTLPTTPFSSFMSNYFGDNDLKYNVRYRQVDPNTFDAELVEALASGDGPDAIILPQDLIVRYSNKVYLIPFTVLPELTFKQTFIQEGELYLNNTGVLALPFMVDPLVMYWNRDVFNNQGVTKPPTNWSDITNLVSKMTEKDPAQNILRSTVALGEFRNITNAKSLLSALFLQTGNKIVNLNLTDNSFATVLDSSNSSNSGTSLALQFYTNFSNPVRPEYSWNRSLPSSIDAFANGDLAIYFGFASEFTKIKDKNPNLNFDVALLPQAKGAQTNITFGNMLGLAILKNTPDPAGTYSVISAITSAQAVPFWINSFNLPSARRDVLNNPEPSAVKSIFNQSAIISRAWFDPDASETSRIFQEMVESYTTGQETLEGAINTAADRLDNVLAK